MLAIRTPRTRKQRERERERGNPLQGEAEEDEAIVACVMQACSIDELGLGLPLLVRSP